ncbi:AAA family ATPase [Candidatus Woesearchaeota archaeon]|nr:MAG: AAA family ATPase [Candidatus Woesearchaeota archaeon]
MIIAVSGTPGTGKSTLAKELAKALRYYYVDVLKFIKENKLSDGFDKERDCEIIDVKKLNKALEKFLKSKNAVVDSHLSHNLPKKLVDICIITKCELKELRRRLELRKYSEKKIRENLEAEIFDTCYQEADQKGHKTIVVDTTKGFKIKEIIKLIKIMGLH